MIDREIKFRVWDKRKKFFYHWYELNNALTGFINNEDYIVTQFTGLKDINGKEMYEGDIVCALSSDNQYLSIIEWSENGAMWGFRSIKCKNMSFSYILDAGCSKWEVRGNVFENPELLK